MPVTTHCHGRLKPVASVQPTVSGSVTHEAHWQVPPWEPEASAEPDSIIYRVGRSRSAEFVLSGSGSYYALNLKYGAGITHYVTPSHWQAGDTSS